MVLNPHWSGHPHVHHARSEPHALLGCSVSFVPGKEPGLPFGMGKPLGSSPSRGQDAAGVPGAPRSSWHAVTSSLAAVPALAAPRARHKQRLRRSAGRGEQYLERQEQWQSSRCGRSRHRLNARSQRAFVGPGRAQRCCQHGGAIPAPAAPSVGRQLAQCPGSAPCPSAGCEASVAKLHRPGRAGLRVGSAVGAATRWLQELLLTDPFVPQGSGLIL